MQRQLMQLQWQHGVDRLALSHGAWMLILHAYRHHTEEAPGLPPLRGGLAPVVIKRVQEYLQAHLADSVTLAELAQQAGLSEYHFARMFGQSLGCPPHRYLLGCCGSNGPSSCWPALSRWPVSPVSVASLPRPISAIVFARRLV